MTKKRIPMPPYTKVLQTNHSKKPSKQTDLSLEESPKKYVFDLNNNLIELNKLHNLDLIFIIHNMEDTFNSMSNSLTSIEDAFKSWGDLAGYADLKEELRRRGITNDS